MENKIINYINMHITAMTREEEEGFRKYLATQIKRAIARGKNE